MVLFGKQRRCKNIRQTAQTQNSSAIFILLLVMYVFICARANSECRFNVAVFQYFNGLRTYALIFFFNSTCESKGQEVLTTSCSLT